MQARLASPTTADVSSSGPANRVAARWSFQPLARLAAQTLQAMARWRENAWQRVEFNRLSERDLRDMGMCRSEYASCMCEAEGRIAATRLRLWQAATAAEHGGRDWRYL